MSKRNWLRILAIVIVGMLALLLLSLHRAGGQLPRAEDPVSRGQHLVRAWCSECHAVGPPGVRARHDLDFTAIANMTSTTELSLRVFLQSSHVGMPNLIVKGRDLDDIVAFILSLKQG